MKYETVLDRLSPKIRAISKKVKTRYTYCDEDDFFQEAVLNLWLLHKEGKLDDKTDSYILQGCYFLLKNYIRRICKSVDAASVSMNEQVDDEGRTIGDTLPADVYHSGTDSVEIVLMLEEAEGLFTDRERDLFYYQLEGYTVREIGEKMGVSHVSVVKAGSKMREKCRILMGELV